MSSSWTQPIRRIRRVVVLLLVLLALSACGQPSRTTAEPLATSTTAATTVAASPAVTATTEPTAAPMATPANDAQPLRSELREGRGLVVLLRHARTVPGTGDPPGFQLDDCTTQRNLSEEGRAQAQRIGAAFRAQAIEFIPIYLFEDQTSETARSG